MPIALPSRAFAQGIGEKLTPAAPEELWYLVIHPAVAVSTKSIFQHPDLPRATTPLNWPHWTWRNTQNNCEALVRRLYPEVAKALDWLLQYAPARLTGTGYDERGLDKYYGLLELGELGGLWKNVAGRYEIDGKKIYAKQILASPEEYFTDDVMEKLDAIARETFAYG